MIFCLTNKDMYINEQLSIRAKIYGVRKFALFPTNLKSRQWIWLDYYWSYYHGGMNEDGSLFLWSTNSDSYSPSRDYHQYKSYDHVQLFHHDKITNSWKRISNENC